MVQFGGVNAQQSYQGALNGGPVGQINDYEKALREDLQAFIIKTKQLMGANSEEYQKFKANCKESVGNNDIVKCLKSVQECLRPHNELMEDLNRLLPARFQVEDAVDMNNAIDFIHQIKEKATGIYQTFIDTLKKHDKKEINMFQMNAIIQELMLPYPNLLDQFKRFLPEFTTQNASVEEKPPQQQAPQPTKGKKGLKQVQQKQDNEKSQVQQPAPQPTKKSLIAKVNQAPSIVANAASNKSRQQQQQEVDEQIAQNEILFNQNSVINSALVAQSQIKSFPKTEQAFFEKLRLSLRDDNVYDDIMKCFFCYIEGVFNQYELFELISPFFDRNNEDILVSMKSLVGQRDTSRRNHNLLCKPFSEFDTSHFKKISYSYYEMPLDFPRPICSGRNKAEFKQLCKQIFNDDYSSLPTGSESFKFKTKNQYEDVLFRLEDEMYKADHEVGNFLKTMKVLEEEKSKIDKMDQAEKENYKIDPLKFNTIRMKWIEKTYGEMGQEIIKLIPQNPIKAIPIIYDRFKTNYARAVEEKEEQLRGWRETCDKNFHKSLDHRSFHFKFYEKKNSMPKAYLNELKNLASSCLKSKNLNQLKGGCKDSPFFGTYAAFEPICVHSYESMNTPEIKQDHPINLEDPELLKNVEILPQMRFLMNDENKFSLAIQLVLAGIRIVSYNSTEKEKARTTLRNILEQFFCSQNYVELREVSSALVYLAEEQIDVICSQDYYEAKSKGQFSFTRTDIPLSELRSKLLEQQEANQLLQQLNQPVQQKNEEEENKNENGTNSQKVEKDEVLSPEPKVSTANKNSMTQQLKPVQLQTNDQDATINSSPIFVPNYKPGYKLMITTQNHYIFFKQVYTIYERLLKARDLISLKVDEDLLLKQQPHLEDEANGGGAQAYKTERFDVFIGGILSAMSGNLDTGKYEDFARQLLGSRAYLLFSFDKLITATVKQIMSIANDEASQKSFGVFQKFQQLNGNKQIRDLPANDTIFNESIYLSHFASTMADVNNFSGVGVRLLFSPLSKILSIHYFSTNSFNLQDTKKLYQEANTYIENQTLDEVASSFAAPPSIYLKRQVKIISKIRKIEDVHMSNQIIPRIQPQVYRMQFDANSEDILLIRRKTKLKVEEEFMHDIKVKLQFDQLKRQKYDEISSNNVNTASTNNSASGTRPNLAPPQTSNSNGPPAGNPNNNNGRENEPIDDPENQDMVNGQIDGAAENEQVVEVAQDQQQQQ